MAGLCSSPRVEGLSNRTELGTELDTHFLYRKDRRFGETELDTHFLYRKDRRFGSGLDFAKHACDSEDR